MLPHSPLLFRLQIIPFLSGENHVSSNLKVLKVNVSDKLMDRRVLYGLKNSPNS